MSVAERILERLAEHGVAITVRDHPPARTAIEAAELRGTPLEAGCKAIVMKLGKAFAVLAFGADRQIDNRKLRRRLGVRRYRFATEDELLELTGGLRPGSVPPFGRPIFDLPLYADQDRAQRDPFWFTNGLRTQSVCLSASDWRRVAAPDDVFDFTRDPVGEDDRSVG